MKERHGEDEITQIINDILIRLVWKNFDKDMLTFGTCNTTSSEIHIAVLILGLVPRIQWIGFSDAHYVIHIYFILFTVHWWTSQHVQVSPISRAMPCFALPVLNNIVFTTRQSTGYLPKTTRTVILSTLSLKFGYVLCKTH